MLCMVYHACLLCCGMNLDHCMYVFHASLLIDFYQSFQIRQEVHSWCGIPLLWEARYVTVGNREEMQWCSKCTCEGSIKCDSNDISQILIEGEWSDPLSCESEQQDHLGKLRQYA